MRFGNVSNERVQIFDHIVETVCRAAFPRRSAVTARIPRENCDVIEA